MKMRFYYILLVANSLSNCLLYFPFILLTNAEHGLPFALIIGLVLASIFAYMMTYIYNNNKGKNLVQISSELFGKNIGNIIMIIFILLRFSIAGFIFAGLVKGINLYLMPLTPVWQVSLSVALILLIALRQSRRNYLHCKAFFTVSMSPWIIIILIMGIKSMNYDYLRGTILHSFHMPKLTMIAPAVFFFTGVHHIAIFNTNFNERLSFKGTFFTYALICLPFAILSLAIPLGTWGPSAIKTLKFLETITADTMRTEFFFIERVLFIASPIYVTLTIMNIENYTYVGFGILKDMGVSRKVYNASVFIILLIYIIFTSYIGEVNRLFSAAGSFCVIWLIIHSIKIMLLYTFTKLKEGKTA